MPRRYRLPTVSATGPVGHRAARRRRRATARPSLAPELQRESGEWRRRGGGRGRWVRAGAPAATCARPARLRRARAGSPLGVVVSSRFRGARRRPCRRAAQQRPVHGVRAGQLQRARAAPGGAPAAPDGHAQDHGRPGRRPGSPSRKKTMIFHRPCSKRSIHTETAPNRISVFSIPWFRAAESNSPAATANYSATRTKKYAGNASTSFQKPIKAFTRRPGPSKRLRTPKP